MRLSKILGALLSVLGIDLDRPVRTFEDAGMPSDGDPLTAERVTPRELLNWGAARVYRDTNGKICWRWVTNTAGVVPVTEASGANISAYLGYVLNDLRSGQVLQPDASGAGGHLTAADWKPIAPVIKSADGAGTVTVVEIFPAGAAGKKNDCMLYFMCNTTGAYTIEIVEATGGAKGEVVPAHVLTAVSLVAGYVYGIPYGLRFMNTTAQTNIGLKDGVAIWPANAQVIFWGFKREV